MTTQMDLFLRQAITSVKQQSEFGPDMKERQFVTVYFVTPHDFDGKVKMPQADYTDPDVRAQKVMQAIIDLEGPFWDHGEEIEESEL